jgi:hypothetical protein
LNAYSWRSLRILLFVSLLSFSIMEHPIRPQGLVIPFRSRVEVEAEGSHVSQSARSAGALTAPTWGFALKIGGTA